jgi:gamma-glutamylcyclotransferase (GGCT)/AIG2-like uncharacterized protein YtfP
MPRLFSYGTLQQESVQHATFGRTLTGHRDQLMYYELSTVTIEDPQVIELSGKAEHPAARFTGHAADRVDGMVFDITDDELRAADEYEVAAYQRVTGTLASGAAAWVYVDARHAPANAFG